MKKIEKTKWLYLAISGFMFLFMVYYSEMQSFWYDEVYQIGLVSDKYSFGDILFRYSQLKDYTPPLFAVISACWIRVVPFSARYLLLISEAAAAAGVFVVAMTGENIRGKRAGVISAVLGAVSSCLILNGGFEFRSYGLFFLCSALVLYWFIRRMKEPCIKHTIIYGIMLMLLVYSHYYGAIICGALFFADVFFFFRKKIHISAIWSYVIAGGSFLPWMVAVALNHMRSVSEFWIQPPNWRSVNEVFQYLTGGQQLTYYVVVFGLVGLLVSVCLAWKKKYFTDEMHGVFLSILWVIFFVIGSMYVYGAYVNPEGGIFYNRYFLGLLPYCILAAGITLGVLCEKLEKFHIPYAGAVIAIFLFVAIGQEAYTGVVTDVNRKNAYDKAYSALKKKTDITAEKVVILTSDNSCVKDGFEYYFSKKGKAIDAKLLSQHDEDFSEQIRLYDTIYLFQGKQPVTEQTSEILNTHYTVSEQDDDAKIVKYAKK